MSPLPSSDGRTLSAEKVLFSRHLSLVDLVVSSARFDPHDERFVGAVSTPWW